jgi:hypothetical protein
MDEVKKRIAGADLVIVDFTGRNTNVSYEAGLADARQKDWIVLAQASEDMTFDVRHIGSWRPLRHRLRPKRGTRPRRRRRNLLRLPCPNRCRAGDASASLDRRRGRNRGGAGSAQR